MTDGLPPCTSCGACCATLHDEGTVADLDPRDVKRLGARRLTLYCVDSGSRGGEEPSWATQSTENKSGQIVCRALRGTVGRRASCAIYEDRPALCRAFKRGSRGCLEAREQGSLR